MDINELIDRVKKLDFVQAIHDAVIDDPKPFTALQREQMTKGINSEGNKIGRYGSKAYADKKFRLSQKAGYGNVDLKLTGAFQDDIVVLPDETGLIITSYDDKLVDLGAKYGDDLIFGLSYEYREEYVESFLMFAINHRLQKQIYG